MGVPLHGRYFKYSILNVFWLVQNSTLSPFAKLVGQGDGLGDADNTAIRVWVGSIRKRTGTMQGALRTGRRAPLPNRMDGHNEIVGVRAIPIQVLNRQQPILNPQP